MLLTLTTQPCANTSIEIIEPPEVASVCTGYNDPVKCGDLRNFGNFLKEEQRGCATENLGVRAARKGGADGCRGGFVRRLSRTDSEHKTGPSLGGPGGTLAGHDTVSSIGVVNRGKLCYDPCRTVARKDIFECTSMLSCTYGGACSFESETEEAKDNKTTMQINTLNP